MHTLGKISNVLRDAKVIAEISVDNAVLELKHGHVTNVIVHSIN